MTTSSDRHQLAPGTAVEGKWNGRRYVLERLLGIGSNGHVYLAASGRAACAIKIGRDAADLQAEANVLASLNRTERGRPPFLLDVDDWVRDGQDVPFYVMRYVPGVPVRKYLKRHGANWFGVIGSRLLERLSELHEAGWVFGDIKSDNVLVTEYGRVELVDYGGMTAMGRSVRQFTEIYDRGYWGAGGRTAEPSYDWFAVAVLWLHALDGKRLMQLTATLLPQNRHPRELMRLVHTHPLLNPLEGWMERALHGQFRDSRDASGAWRTALRSAQGAKDRDEDRVPGWMAGLFAASIVLCGTLAALWLFG